NTWHHDQGLLAQNPNKRPSDEAADFFHHVDWSRTKAYALGLGGVYLNLAGREGQGIVAADEAQPLKSQLARKLSGLVDPQTGRVAVRSAVAREEVYRGPYTAEAPDLLVNFAEGYRCSWATTLGGVPQGHFEDNTRRWAGDHIIDPLLVPGVLLMSRPFRTKARLTDLAPTILAALGAPIPQAMEGEPLV
ncbi:MAG: nucleotide pyrophosphatase, partial [Pirellulales bacterium]